jgi:hypothetical protein
MEKKMKKKLPIFIAAFLLLNIPLIYASKLAPLEINSLEKQSAFILIGKIQKTTLLKKNKNGAKNYKVEVKAISYLKGKAEAKIITFSFWYGGLKGFNTIPKENTYWIFFLGSLTKEQGKLVHPSAMVKFTREVWDKE